MGCPARPVELLSEPKGQGTPSPFDVPSPTTPRPGQPRVSGVATTLEGAGEALARELLAAAPVVDLREQIEPQLRAEGDPATASGCPCGCGDVELLERARANDEVALTALLERYRALARGKARSYFLLGADREDVVQEGMIGVYKAIRDYDERHGASFRTFAELCVTRQIVSAVKAATRLKHRPLSQSLSLDVPLGPSEDGGSTLADLLPALGSSDPAHAAISADELRALQRHFDEVLSDLELQVLRHHIEGKSYQQIAAMLQRHTKSIDNALQRIRQKTQGHLDSRRDTDAG